MNLVEYPSRVALMAGLAEVIARQLRDALAADGRATLAVPGGTTPGPVFDALSLADLDWARVSVLLTDERWVPQTNARSNTRLLRERLFANRATAARLVPLYAPAPVPEDALHGLSAGITAALPLTVCLLGMGEDMHIASLFPGADRLADGLRPDAPPLLPMRAEAAGEPRVTLTAPVLAGAGALHILITGAAKRAAITTANSLSPLQAPVACVLDRALIHWAD